MRYFVVPDLHGNGALLSLLIEKELVPTSARERFNAGIHVVQLGDLANCVRGSVVADIQILAQAAEVCDTVLVGNHEFPYLGGEPSFDGFHFDAGVKTRLDALGDNLQPCLLAGDVLLTHAGATDEWGWETAAEADEEIEYEWTTGGRQHAMFTMIGLARGGLHPFGGILWSDFNTDPRAPFRQVHGHTPIHSGPGVKCMAGVDDGFWKNGRSDWQGSIDLDVGCGKGATRVVALWLDDVTGAFKLVEHHAP